ncbi:hypothetical protein EXIGLDRAFT_390738 [Exidia glandulosa HHB12029]|uniref:Uncharacterized protein n=1 Tax=Exidia glandulosa HHB12029 TaxID=1314781 RepID=A0A165KZR1_EXIGL|nr:hypothetical protein EXIGLDRAFT_390738 [Exidia glandulosa HHB12029]
MVGFSLSPNHISSTTRHLKIPREPQELNPSSCLFPQTASSRLLWFLFWHCAARFFSFLLVLLCLGWVLCGLLWARAAFLCLPGLQIPCTGR